ncbi:Transglut_core3 domain-containing protein [Gammaproteobacteria bacterium]
MIRSELNFGNYLGAAAVLNKTFHFRRKFSHFLRLPRFEKMWLFPVWGLLGLSRLTILSIQFRRLAPYLGGHMGNCAVVPVLSPQQQRRALQIGRVVRLAARYTPWESNCFPQAVTARLLLGLYRIPYALFFGVYKDEENFHELKAHAWVAAGPVRVTGGDGFWQFAVVGVFVSHGLFAVND